MNVELINTGTELMLGRVLNTHQQWLCRRLADLGYPVSRQVAVPDSGESITDATREALSRADLVVVTGGLGPTSDDRTRELIAELLGQRLVVNNTALENIQSFFTARNRPMPAGVARQAQVPERAIVLQNAHGTAPGLVLEVSAGAFRAGARSSWLVMLPGPPRELHPMFNEQVNPFLRERLPLVSALHCVTLRTVGMGESLVEERIAGAMAPLVTRGLELGYCARSGEVDVRLAARGADALELVRGAERVVRRLLGRHIFGGEDDLLEQVIVRALTARGETLAVAESCTGGFIAHRITNVAGASRVFWGGWVSYDNAAKERELGVSGQSLAAHGAVSEAVVREMAEGARREAGTDYALAVTGIAGPSGGDVEKPVGTVFIGLASGAGTGVRRFLNPYDRETFKYVTSQQALDLLRQALSA